MRHTREEIEGLVELVKLEIVQPKLFVIDTNGVLARFVAEGFSMDSSAEWMTGKPEVDEVDWAERGCW